MKSKKEKSAPKVTSKSKNLVSLDELLNVLSFYGNKENYFEKYDGKYPNEYQPAKIEKDSGSKARKILKKLVKENLEKEGIDNNL